jgi:hypothetical protein
MIELLSMVIAIAMLLLGSEPECKEISARLGRQLAAALTSSLLPHEGVHLPWPVQYSNMNISRAHCMRRAVC